MKTIIKSVVICCLLAITSNCGLIDASGTVEYTVSASKAGFSITYQNASGNTEQLDVNTASWNKTFKGNIGDFVYVAAQAKNKSTSITATIKYKGKVIEQSSSSGDYVIATASGTIE